MKENQNKDEVVDKYRGIHLAYYNYKEGEYFVEDFLNEDFLIDWIIITAADHDQGITHEGLDFIDEYYGNNYIIDMVLKKDPRFPFGYGKPYEFLGNHKEQSYSAKK